METACRRTEVQVPLYSLNNSDLNMYQCGIQNCDPGHFYGPAVRDHFLIHYVLAGKGKYCFDDKVYYLQKGQGFLICPGKITYYQADLEDPWTYTWVGFHGLKAEAYLKEALLTEGNPIFTYDKDDSMAKCFTEMIAAKKCQKARGIRALGYLYVFLSQLVEECANDRFIDYPSNRKEIYLRKTIEFIEMNYSRKIAINDIAGYIGLDRSYLGSIFKQKLNTSLQDFLINYRINKGCELMKNENLAVGDIARSVGYEDPLLFSKTFRKIKGMPPREYRKRYHTVWK
ncbi:MAG: AraC family transcriptional regulator [Ruminiclostridium sp.]|nr:AraC family transcriptional regulator [Ruminiclostridium sp.]